ncbi:Gfo/Idh/MocA family oxidoreductase [Candidatus Poribacteria bacterium]|nr:Gfo/Idh/MocA family oxidoreductase [Candidatus Poribacteria bacterium]
MTLKWGVLGVGSVAHRRTIPAINKAKNAELHALFCRTEEKAKRMAEEHGAKRYYTNADELIADEELDAIYISTPPYLHCEYTLKAAERGLEIMCEKPMAVSVAECEKMIAAGEKNRVGIQLCFLFRFHSCFRNIKSMIAGGQLGEIVGARMPIFKVSGHLEGDWHTIRAEGGGGSLMDQGAHSIDLIRYLIGEISEVTAFCSTFADVYKDVEDVGTIMMKMANGAHAVANTSFVAPVYDVVFEVYGTKGWVLVYNDNGWHVKTNINGEVKVEPSKYEDLFQMQFEHLARCVSKEEKPIITGIDGLKNIQAISAAYESARAGRTIKL